MFSQYTVLFYDEYIDTWVTDEPSVVRRWIYLVQHIHRYRLHKLIVGLDIEWRPTFVRSANQPAVATLQLCVGHKCLIFQLIHARHMPPLLCQFLSNPSYTFVGVGVEQDASKLFRDYGLEVSYRVDLRGLAAQRLEDGSLFDASLRRLARKVLDKDFEKPKWVTTSRWDNAELTFQQVQYACYDAFVSFEVGRVLRASSG